MNTSDRDSRVAAECTNAERSSPCVFDIIRLRLMFHPLSSLSLVRLCFFCSLTAAAPLSLKAWAAGFTFNSFNDTTSLLLIGDANTSACDDGASYAYASSSAVVSRIAIDESASVRRVTALRTLVEGDEEHDSHTVDESRHYHPRAPGRCPLRARLTPSRPYKAGAVVHERPLPALVGWETGFTFQLTDASRMCTDVTDAAFGTAVHRACSITGGDGLAFVVHADARGAAAIGSGGGGMGYNGLHGALAIQFDSFYNAVDGDIPFDHITVHASGAGGVGQGDAAARTVDATSATSIGGAPRAVNIADGLVHSVRVAYVPYLNMNWAPYFSASEALTPLLKATGTASPLGTLAVWFDVGADAIVGCGNKLCEGEGAGETQSLPPTLALPIALGSVLQRDGGDAWFAITAATGATAWQKHDILSWYWCGAVGCPIAVLGEDVDSGFVEDDRWWSPSGNASTL